MILYNPALLPPARSSLLCSLRRPLVERLLATLRRIGERGAPQHQLVLGEPGSGKTMLLRALRIAIESDPELGPRWLPVTFPEAQWDVARPADFWANTLEYLAVSLERRGEERPAGTLRNELARIRALDPTTDDGRHGLETLLAMSDRLERRFVLLVDSLDVVLERLKRDQWHVREILASESRLLLIGASARAVEATYHYDAAFYDFFQLHELRPLPLEGLVAQLESLPADPDRDALLSLAPSALGAVLTLIGTQPRTLMMLAHALRLEGVRPVKELVWDVLDQMTPWMSARMNAMSPQSQAIVHALAAAWHPARATELARRTHLTVNAVSSHIHRLVQEGTVERVPLPPEARHGYQLVDRVFQVWLLLRMGQPHRRVLGEAADMVFAAFSDGPVTPFDARTERALHGGDEGVRERLAPELRAAVDRARKKMP